MPNNYQIYYEIKALDKASAIFDKVDNRIKQMNKNLMESQKYHQRLSVAQKSIKNAVDKETAGRVKLGYELKKNAYFYDMLDKQKEKARESWASEINRAERKKNLEMKLHNQKMDNIRKEQIAQEKADRRKLAAQRRLENARFNFNIRQADRGYQSARTALMYGTTPTALTMGASLRNTMTMEQFNISLGALYGSESEKVKNELLKYSYETQYTLREASQMAIDIRKGAKNVKGLESTEAQIAATKMIGNVALAFATRPEDRQEISYQIGQGIMRGAYNERQDIRVMSARGLPIYAAAEAVMGMSWKKIKETYGAEIPAPIILEALRYLEKSPEVFKSLEERSKSLTLSWEQFKESSFLVSSQYGEIFDKSLGIRKVLASTADIMFDHYKNLNKGQTEGLANTIKLGVILGALVPTITLAVFGIQKMSLYMQKTKLEATALSMNIRGIYSTYSMISSLVSAAYLTTVDWKDVINDIKEKGIAGVFEHLDVILATIFTINGVLGGFKSIKALGLEKSMTKSLKMAKSIAMVLGPLIAAPAAAYYGTSFLLKKLDERANEKFLKRIGVDPELEKRNKEKIKDLYVYDQQGRAIAVKNEIKIDVQQNNLGGFDVKNIESKAEAKDPFANAITVYDIGE